MKLIMPNGHFKPGEQVLTTGIYTATHHQHRRSHDVLVAKGERFPSCKKCGTRVHFELLQAATHIEGDRDFAKTDGAPKKAGFGRRQNS